MDAPSVPLTIVREERIDLSKERWWWSSSRLPPRGWRVWLWRLGWLCLPAIAIYEISTGESRVPWFGWLALATLGSIAFLSVWQDVVRQRRRLRQGLGNTITIFIAFTADGVEYGTRGASSTRFTWWSCSAEFGQGWLTIRHHTPTYDRMDIAVALAGFSPQEVAQIRYWHHRAHGLPDPCPQCRYDLTGSPGPTCPECGAAVRIADVSDLPAPQPRT